MLVFDQTLFLWFVSVWRELRVEVWGVFCPCGYSVILVSFAEKTKANLFWESVSCSLFVHPYINTTMFRLLAFLVAQTVKTACNAAEPGLIPGVGRAPGVGAWQSTPLSLLENPMDRGAWWAAVHKVTCSFCVNPPTLLSFIRIFFEYYRILTFP